MADKTPNLAELQRDITEFIKSKYGDKIVVPEPEVQKPPEDGMRTKTSENKISFDLKPEELEAHLKKYVIQQEDAIEILATKICTHFNRMNLELNSQDDEIVGNIKSNVLMIGPTGVGKTYLIRLIAQKIGVPFVKGDATKYSETGYVGGDVEDLIRELVREANGDIQMAEYGIVYLDEIDKIASSGNTVGPDVSRTGVQRNLLKLMEESEVELRPPHDLASQMEAMFEAQKQGKVVRKKVNTKNILFVMSGAFVNLDKIVRKRLKQQAIGFQAAETTQNMEDATDYLKYVKSEDLIEYGFESEFVGRLPVVVRLAALEETALYEIIKNSYSSVVRSKKRDFQAYGITLEFEDEALRHLAREAFLEKTGARGLVSVFEKALMKFEKKLPSTHIKKLVVTAQIVRNPETELKILLDNYSLKEFQKQFLARTGIVITFTPGAKKEIIAQAHQENKDFVTICWELFSNYEYGLKLLNLGEFLVDEAILQDPKGRLELLIKETYHGPANKNT
ncbi:AAA family ATPase [candidate division KSB1 bacterium]|nr:AAA family ATPase [candidate division KSB1 bacterium]